MSFDLMYKATDKAAWDAWVSSEDFPQSGILIDEIGPIGENTEYHVNVRILDDTVDCAALAQGGTGVNWVDPALVATPARIWAGGMNYWMPVVGGGG